MDGCRRVVQGVSKPVQVRRGTLDACLLAQITLCAGFSAFQAGISCNIPCTTNAAIRRSIREWR